MIALGIHLQQWPAKCSLNSGIAHVGVNHGCRCAHGGRECRKACSRSRYCCHWLCSKRQTFAEGRLVNLHHGANAGLFQVLHFFANGGAS